ncbi:uncharacterized protein LOC106160400 [Lingula anatina]|uniref:Uncharacterized protein LOC106160400 n=1 Tax=Lingula anatina TaxID=7574 RepID=A0A1S3I2F2_LINAN|nr:uncharacterized protein LOC106160400 [Lingula anatina]|eukprot:XP_013392445.1 uncharacterized protein LOC106160400 [Lingula anatina]
MATTEVFRPSNTPLHVRPKTQQEGAFQHADKQHKRPATQSGYRFGQLSHNSFFTRHNPHPRRVRHLKGLLDMPICSVNDDGFFASPRYSLFYNSPNSYNDAKSMQRGLGVTLPVNAINVNSTLHPINTITGLQHFTGLNSYPFREKAVPKVGMVPQTEAWRDELKMLTELAQYNPSEDRRLKPEEKKVEEMTRPKTQYSSETGRLIPPPSRAMTRQGSRQNKRQQFFSQYEHIAPEPDMETMVFQMLAQILQTDDPNAVQAWLVSSGEREKALVLDMIRAAITSREEYYNKAGNPQEYVEPSRVGTAMDRIATASVERVQTAMLGITEATQTGASLEGSAQIINRLNLEGDKPVEEHSLAGDIDAAGSQDRNWTARYSWTPEREAKKAPAFLPEINQKGGEEVVSPVFRVKNSPRKSPRKESPREAMPPIPKSPVKVATPRSPRKDSPKLRYTTPTKDEAQAAAEKAAKIRSILLEQEQAWQQEKSIP